MKKVTTVIMVLSLILGSVALVAAAEMPQSSKDLQLSTLQKITDQEGQQIRGTGLGFGGYQFNNPGIFSGINCPQSQTSAITSGIKLQLRDQTRIPGSCK